MEISEALKKRENKVKPTLVHPDITEELARVFEFGMTKYHKGSWQKFTPEQAMEVLPDAAQRHFNQWLRGERLDSESGLPHLVCAAWNLLVTHWHESRGTE
jgi:hypothetical protein